MCCALHPAEFRHTFVYAAETLRNDRVVHVLGYANRAYNQNKPGVVRRLLGAAPGNAMLLHFPARAMSEKNIVDTTDSVHWLSQMQAAVWPPPKRDDGRSALGAPLETAARAAAQVFDSGVYTVVLAHDARAIPDALARVPIEKRPTRNDAIFDWYAATFPKWPIALCCFASDVHEPPPLLWWYEPLNERELFAPAVDAHNGRPPRIGADVDVDHHVFFGSHRFADGAGARVPYDDAPIANDVRALLSPRVIGTRAHGKMKNGDFIASVDDVRAGRAVTQRRPPHAPAMSSW